MKDEFTRRNNITGLSDAGELPLTSVENLTPIDIGSYGNNAIAIVGMACRLPGDIKTPEQCWRALVDNHSLIHPISSERQKLCPPLSSRLLGEAGCINNIDCFDAAFFQLSPREAQWLEPQQRLMLEISWSALESAGISPKKESGKVNGIFIGITNSEYADLVKNYSPESVDAYFGTGNVNAMAAGRLAYFYDWRGPAISIDTACSSSLVAIHMACRSLLHHECNLAVAGGIHLLLDDKRFIAYRHAGMLSPTHRCKTFDDTADGYVRSEGGAVFVLKRLQDALNDGDPIQAVIRGSAINQDGRGQGLTAPNAIAQQALISAALEQAGLPPESIRYLEAHGTGTSLGDPIEVMAAAEALCKQRRKDDPLLLGSNKSLFGHQEAAAGAVGLLKTVLAMQHGVLPSQRNFSTPNHRIPWSRLPLRVVDKNQPWPEGKKRAGVSSFGFSGTNSHVIVEEYQAETAGGIINKKKAPVAIILSAKKPDRLLERCTQLLNYLHTHQPDIHDLAYTLQQGRDEMKFRCGFSACTIDEVKEHVQEILTVGLVNSHKERRFYCGSAKPSSECKGRGSDSVENLDLDSTLTHDDINQVISEWVCGAEVNWDALYRSEIPHRLSLPTYPFSSDRHWFLNSAQEEKQSNGDIYTFSITPISNSKKNVHTSRVFIGDEWFLDEHVINDSRIMPGAAQLAMIRTVANDYWGDVKTFHLSNIVWLRPIVADSPIEIHVDFISESDEVTRYELYSFVGTERLVHSGGYISPQNTVAPSRVDLTNLRDQCQRRIPKREFYEKFDGMGLNYGAGFTVLEEAYAGSNIALGKLSDPITTKNFIWPLNIIDGALQVGLVFLDSDKNSVPMPFALKDMQVWEPIPLSGWVSAVPSSDDTPAVRKLDITVMDESGRIAVRILGFSTRFGKKKTISDPIVYPASVLNSGVQAMNSDHTHSLTALTIIKRTLSGLIAEHLKMPEHELDDETPLSEFGFDSITMTSFSHLLNQRYGLNLNATVLYEAPTIAALAGYLRQAQPGLMASLAATSGLQPPETESVASGVPSPAVSKEGDTHIRPTSAHASYPNNEPIAIIGMSGCFPLSNDIDALWENLLAGRDCIRELPPERWGGNPSPALKHAGVIDGLEFFDPLFFGISPREAKSLDPYQRLLMQTVYNVIEEAGYSVGSLSGSNTALLVATYSSGYRQLQALAGEPVESYSITSIVSSMGPNRMSHWLNWHGPSEPIETACSSSLVGIHRAVQLLRNGECDQAVVGGVNALVTMDMHESLTLAGFLSPTGKCRAFSANVDGYVRSEGAGMLFLKPLAAAERDGDHIYGLIKGSGVNHGGRSSSLTTPNAKAQTDLIERTLRHSGITPDTISYIEAHATGTPVGDPIECKALKDAFTALDDGKINLSHRCGLGSIKSNIGHLEVAAGVAGVIKVLLQLRHRKLVPSINSQPCNPKIDFANSPFYVVTETQDWIAPKDQDGRNLPLRACVNSFGFGGVNAHVILEEYVSEQDNKSLPECAEPVVLVLSARNEERLRLRAQQLCQVMREGAVDLRALAYTLQVGRDAMKARLAIVVNSQDEAIQKLLSFVSNGRDENNGYYNLLKSLSTHAEKDRVIPAYPSDIPALSRLAQSWIQGEMIDWVVLYPGKKPRRLSLPTYPFAKVSHWIPEQITNAPAVSPSQPAKLQPGETCSQDYSYAVQVTGSESWLGLLRRQDIPQMPCSVQLEWVRSAVCVLMEKETSVTLEQVLWLAPLKATAPQNIRIYLKPEGEGRFRYEIRTENTKDEQTIHGRGLVYQNNPAALAPQSLSITTLRSSNALSVVHGDEYYRRLQQAGIVYSQQAQVTTSYEIGEHCLLGRLSKPKNNDLEGLLARLENGLMLAGLLEKGQEDKALLALSSASFWQPLPDEDIVVWCRPARESNKIMPGWDIQIADDIGNVLIEFRGVTFQPSEPSGDEHPPRQKQNAVLPHSDNATELLSAVPHWRTFSANSLDSPWPDSGPSVLWLSHEFEHDDENRLCQRFHLSQELDHLIWEVSPGNVKNAIYGFRLLKSLLAAGWGSKSLKITLITRQAQALGKHESSDPHQATLFGLMGSASKEYPHWHIRLLDIPLRQSLWFTEWQNIPPDPRGWPQLWRHGKWYQRCLLPCKLASTGTATGFRQNGVVVILGGAGGVGKAFSEYLIRRANTQVIWLGRRAEDATISQYRHDLGRLGPAPLYLQADATDKQQLEHAYAEIISRYGTINGIVSTTGKK